MESLLYADIIAINLSMESQPPNPELRNDPENIHSSGIIVQDNWIKIAEEC